MECRALHGFGASASLGGKASGRFGGLLGLGLLVGFVVGLALSQGGVANLVVTGSSWGWGRMGVMLWFVGILGMIAGTFLWAGRGSGIVWSLVFHVEL